MADQLNQQAHEVCPICLQESQKFTSEQERNNFKKQINDLKRRIADLQHLKAQDEEYIEFIAHELNRADPVGLAAFTHANTPQQNERLQLEREELRKRFEQLSIKKEILQRRAAARERVKARLMQHFKEREKLRADDDAALDRIRLKEMLLQDLQEQVHVQSKALLTERYTNVIRVFRLMQIDVELPLPPLPRGHQSEVKLVGCSSIGGYPFPNSCYCGGLPLDVVMIVIKLIAQLVGAVASAMNVPLPHGIYPFHPNGPVISPNNNPTALYALMPVSVHTTRESSRGFVWQSLDMIYRQQRRQGLTNQQTMAPTASSDSSTTEAHEYTINSVFPQSLMLLQADIVSLCLKVGMTTDNIYPPQAMLLNLYLLNQYCIEWEKNNQIPATLPDPLPLSLFDSEMVEEVRCKLQERWQERVSNTGSRSHRLYTANAGENGEESESNALKQHDEEWQIIDEDEEYDGEEYNDANK